MSAPFLVLCPANMSGETAEDDESASALPSSWRSQAFCQHFRSVGKLLCLHLTVTSLFRSNLDPIKVKTKCKLLLQCTEKDTRLPFLHITHYRCLVWKIRCLLSGEFAYEVTLFVTRGFSCSALAARSKPAEACCGTAEISCE